MADISAVVIPIVQPLINKLGSEVWKELDLICGLESDLKKLEQLLWMINGALDGAEEKPITDRGVQTWLRSIKDAAYDAHDVVDEFRTEALRRQILRTGTVRDFFSINNNPFLFRYVMAHKTRNVLNTIRKLNKEKDDFNFTPAAAASSNPSILLHTNPQTADPINNCSRETQADVDESRVYGRDEDRNAVVDLLVNSDIDKKLCVIPIVGLGGLGKTTLVQYVLKDERVQSHFNPVRWVYVGEKFDLKSIIAAIVNSVDKSSTLDQMRQRLQNEVEGVRGKRFLLVLDNVWNDREERLRDGGMKIEKLADKWGTLKNMLSNAGERGSKILVTTRSNMITKIFGTVEYNLKGLQLEDCWKIFREKAFFELREVEETPELTKIGKEIVRKCDGVPLAAQALGRIVAKRQDEAYWSKVRDNEIWKLQHDGEGIVPALKISYDHLPSYLKQCFKYCSIFPKDYESNRSKLIQLWIAEGFILPNNEELEDTGNDYFSSLLWQLFFREQIKNEFGQILSCKMYDLVHELARYIARDEFVIEEVEITEDAGDLPCSIAKSTSSIEDESNIHLTSRHSTIILDGENCKVKRLILKVGDEAKKMRSLHLLPKKQSHFRGERKERLSHFRGEKRERQSYAKAIVIEKFELDSISNLTYLRVLDLSDVDMLEFPDIVGKLKHLRFLGFSSSSVQELPDSISNLYNLLVLILKGCSKLCKLPKGLGNLRFLRHLDISGCNKLTGMPSGLRRLTALRTLPLFVIGEERGHGVISELQPLNHIRGELKVRNLQNVEDPNDALSAKLVDKCYIQSLELSWTMKSGDPFKENAAAVLENLQPHADLKHLTVKGFDGKNFPDWLSLSLSKLKKLVLENFRGCEDISPLGRLPLLEHLQLHNISGLKKIELSQDNSGGGVIIFRSLNFLELCKLQNLEEWTVTNDGDSLLPSLRKLHIFLCSKLQVKSHLPSAITKLVINESNMMLLEAEDALKGLSKLRSLKIKSMEVPMEEPLKAPVSRGWEGLKCLTALQKLNIDSCHKLSSLPENVFHLPSLQTLKLRYNAIMKTLTKIVDGGESAIKHLSSSLHHLKIDNYGALEALPVWVGGLTSLQSLEISNCPNLKMLPDDLKFPASLVQLTIYGCPHLTQQYQKKGKFFHNIAHIQKVNIDTTSSLEVRHVIRQSQQQTGQTERQSALYRLGSAI